MPMIRALTDADVPRVLEINEANVPAVGSVDAERLRALVAASELAVVVEVDRPTGSIVVGFCLVLGPGATYDSVNYTWFMERFTDAWYLDRVALDAEFQGRGLGSVMYAYVDREITARDRRGPASTG